MSFTEHHIEKDSSASEIFPKPQAEVMELLGLANNGYSYRQSVPKELRPTLDLMVGRGQVVAYKKAAPFGGSLLAEVYVVAEEAEYVRACAAKPY